VRNLGLIFDEHLASTDLITFLSSAIPISINQYQSIIY